MILSGDVQMLENGKRRSYDRAFKVEAVRLVTEERRRMTEVARNLGINPNQLHRWKRMLSEEGQLAFPGKGHLLPDQEELRRLRRELADVTEERDILKKSAGHLFEPPPVRYAFIRDHRKLLGIRMMCKVLKVSRSGYYAWMNRPESPRSMANRRLLSEIRMVHQRSRENYGSPRVTAELHALGVRYGENRVARLMRLNGIRAKRRRKYRATTDSKHGYPVAPNLLARQFSVDRPNAVWVSDITYIWTSEGWLYLAGVVDLYSRMVVGWSMSRQITEELTLEALSQALGWRRPKPGLLHHSDQGGQYAAGDYQDLLQDHQMICSMSRKGDCWDNAPMESFFATLKTELIYRERFTTREEAKVKIFEYIEVFYNRERRHSTLGYQSPVDFEGTATLT